MREKTMGSDLIDVMEAAEILGVPYRSVHHFVRQGLLKPRYPRGRKLNAPVLFVREEIEALHDARKRSFDFTQVGTLALQAHASSRALERRVEFLEQLLGSAYHTLSLEEEDVISLYAQAKECAEFPIIEVDAIMYWSKVLLALGEEFLEVLSSMTNDEEAWHVFLDLSSALIREAPLDQLNYDKELEAAYGYLKYATINMRRTVYLHLHNRLGPRAAQKIIGKPQDVHEEVLRLLAGVLDKHAAVY